MYLYTRYVTTGETMFRITTVYHLCDAETGERQYSISREDAEVAEPSLAFIEQKHFAEVDSKIRANEAGYCNRVVYTPIKTLFGRYEIVSQFYVEHKR